MSVNIATSARLSSSPFRSVYPGSATLHAPDSVAVWQSSPPKPASNASAYCDFDVEELSENDLDYRDNAQVLHPYELEEVETPAPDRKLESSSDDMIAEDDGEETQDSDSAAFARRLRRMRWKPASRPYSFTRPSPAQPNSRKRLRSEVPDTDTDSDGLDSPYTRSEPPRARRRIRGPEDTSVVTTPSYPSEASTPQAPASTLPNDPMDIDERVP
ncbi:hypothetical protein AUEXF2481DRAFT_25362 [Aureobasidium subglaciale EXF-2481]|uniref:Uncharacterized protein n=1 Tax=Aureobasidium subglaciale (strain EXF-2481) TaxID=1043005 RepID=A0A074YTH8_AURSE|nr:uncharacterized protein AUEXF2481DRAFT_25362 [Aureobasidium subglaciale EXF-2481]KAI5206296.1 hypothetical protein E4T38_03908 [Aureobasidium subglaciale]KAI5225141.1 hypothetical protein E4T40_03683 [Aureobasidium subglaciale]KAI5228681.1 hypothetical protein E4T41_03748 [Aureobasidium subglaciale]KAI5263640.1 hypothetical protein E4T46_03524 [Aureobasidium subglaciale]KEQ99459.1 hypothetical protein AUEXF2481DRAFT_25362 [Aureobasidium subglaciale EXF-2481]